MGRSWTTTEIKSLHRFFRSSTSWAEARDAYNQWAKENGLPERSRDALRSQLSYFGVKYGSRKKAVECIETGKQFPSLADAARANSVTVHAVFNCLKGRSKTCAGYHWRYANQQEQSA